MSIASYAELKTAVAAWTKPNTTLSAGELLLIPDYISMAEAEFNRTLMSPQMEATASLSIVNGAVNTPTGLLQVMAMQLAEAPFNNIDQGDVPLLAAVQSFSTGKPDHYRWSGAQFLFNTYTSATAAIRYRKALTPLSDAVASNWLLEAHPDLYLFGSVVQADTRFIDTEQLGIAERRFGRALQQLDDMNKLQNSGRIRSSARMNVV